MRRGGGARMCVDGVPGLVVPGSWRDCAEPLALRGVGSCSAVALGGVLRRSCDAFVCAGRAGFELRSRCGAYQRDRCHDGRHALTDDRSYEGRGVTRDRPGSHSRLERSFGSRGGSAGVVCARSDQTAQRETFDVSTAAVSRPPRAKPLARRAHAPRARQFSTKRRGGPPSARQAVNPPQRTGSCADRAGAAKRRRRRP